MNSVLLDTMSSRKEIVDQAIQFRHPPRIPIWFVNCDQTEGDVMVYHLSLNKDDGSGDNEWGYHLEKLDDGTMGHPTRPYLPDWATADRFAAPPLREEDRMVPLPGFLEECGDRYRLASLDLSGFTVYTLLRGFENSMVDFLVEPERFARLMDTIIDFECELMALVARRGFHGIHLADDWGTQSGLMISPPLWRKLFKPRYRRQFARAHELGLHVWYHCCGNFAEIVDDFHEIGVDVVNIAQPNVVDILPIAQRHRGKQCFLLPISYQTVSISGTVAEIYAEAQRLYNLLGTPSGGFIGYVEEYSCMGMSRDNYLACAEAFRRLM
jgi:uroporphyrinogen decarboxylase